jgi:acetyl-CoA acetyltransferase
MADDFVDEQSLARDMIDVHGAEAATVARENARATVLAGQAAQAKSWIRVLGIIQRRRAGELSPLPDSPTRALSTAGTARKNKNVDSEIKSMSGDL